MDQSSFDRLARVLGAASSRRSTVGAAMGAALAGTFGVAEARKQKHKGIGKNRKSGRKTKAAGVSTEATTCNNPGPSSNLNTCNFNNDDLSGADLSSSSMRETTFRGTNLCGADLSSSQLKDADFRGFAAGNGDATNLTLADLSSSGCRGTRFNSRTILCQTTMCDGSTNNRDCPDDVDPKTICCSDADCGLGQVCGQPGARGVCAGVAATPFGNAEVLEDGSVRLVADAEADTAFAGVRFDVGAALDIDEITRLEAVYNSEVAPGCRLGSPRFQLGTSAGNVFVYFSPDNQCATGPNETPNFIENDSDVYFDASQIEAGRQRITYSEARGILKERQLAVERVSLVVDGAQPGNPQRVVVQPRLAVLRVPAQTA